MWRMGSRSALLAIVATLAVCGAASASEGGRIETAGVSLRVPAGWERTFVPTEPPGANPHTVLVVGTVGVGHRRSPCLVSAYRVPADGAAVVVTGWRGRATAAIPRDRSVLGSLKLRRPYFACWGGWGASALVALRDRAFQVNVLVGDRAAPGVVAAALRVARSFDAG